MDKQGQFIFIKGTIHQKDIPIVSIHTKHHVPSFIKETQLDIKTYIWYILRTFLNATMYPHPAQQ
jgi:hypothetical protein